MAKIAINGFGRIGRMILRASINNPNIQIVAINDLTDSETCCHLLKYDTAQGKFNADIKINGDKIEVNGKQIQKLAEADPTKLPWKALGVDVVMECTGRFLEKDQAQKHIQAGAKKVLLSAPYKGDKLIKTVIKGVNEHTLTKDDQIVSNGSCTTNSLVPVMKVLDDNYKVKRGFITTVHAYTSTQNIVDGPNKDLRRSRAAAMNIVPTKTGASKAMVDVMPQLKDKVDGIALRVPVIDGSITDITVETEKDVSTEMVNALFKSVSANELKGVIQYSEEPLVSSDILGNPHSSIYDAPLTKIIGKNLLKIMVWYDNEWGYSNRMIDIAIIMASK